MLVPAETSTPGVDALEPRGYLALSHPAAGRAVTVGCSVAVNEVVTKASPWSVTETVSRLSALVEGRGMKLFGVIDHSGEAAAHGLELRETTVVIFGSPESGTPVMAAAPLAALDLPLKVLVWADDDGTKLSYTAPAALAARYGLGDELSSRLAGIDALTSALVAG